MFIKKLIIIILITFSTSNLYAEKLQLICFSTVYEPFVINDNGDLKGIDFDLVREICRRLNIEVTFKLKPWIVLEKDLEFGHEKCAVSYFKTSKRLKYLDFMSVPVHVTSYTLFIRKNDKNLYKKLFDFKGSTIGLNRGFKTTKEFEKAKNKKIFKVENVVHEWQSFQMLKHKRLDAVLTNYHVGHYVLKKYKISNIVPILPGFRVTPAYLVFSKKSKLSYLLPKFNKTLKQMIKDGTYDKIYNKYLK